MPAPPELGDRLRLVGGVEILRKAKPEHPPQTDGHVRIGGEIEVDLEGVGHHSHPGTGRSESPLPRHEAGVGNPAHRIGKENLLRESVTESRRAEGESIDGVGSLPQLVSHRTVADDRPSYQLGEHRNVTREIDEVARWHCMPAVEVNAVTHRLEGIKTDSYRQDDIPEELRNLKSFAAEKPCQRSHCIRSEARILKKAEHRQVHHHRSQQACTPLRSRCSLRRNRFSAEVIDHRRTEHKKHEPRVPPTVKNVAGNRQGKVLPRPRHRIIKKQRQRQKIKKEDVGAKNQVVLPKTSSSNPQREVLPTTV